MLFGRLDFQATPQHRFMLRTNFTDYTGENGTSTATTRADSYNGVEGLDTEAWVATYSGQFGANVLNDLNVNYITEDTPRDDKGLDLPDFQVTGLGTYGEVVFLPITSTTERKAIGDTLSILAGNHVFKVGGEYNDTTINQIFKGNWRGVFRFNNKADFLAGKWASYNQFGGLGGLTADEAGGRLRPEGARVLPAGPVVREQPLHVHLRRAPREPGQPERSDPQPERPQRQRLVQPDRRDAGRRPDRPDLAARRHVLVAGRPEDRDPLRGRPLLEPHAGDPAAPSSSPRTACAARSTRSTRRPSGGQLQQPTDPLAPGWGANFTVPGTERIDFTQVPNPRAPGVFAIDPDFENPYTDRADPRRRAGDPALHLGRPRPHLRQGQAAPAADRHQPAVQRRRSAPTACRPTTGRGRTAYYGRITTSLSDAESEYKAVTVNVRRRLRDDFQYYAAVTWSRDEDSDSNERNFAGIQAEDVNNLDLNYGLSNRDQAWRGVLSGLYETPWWGIQLSGAFRYFTGSPYTVSAGSDVNGDTNDGVDRPDHQRRARRAQRRAAAGLLRPRLPRRQGRSTSASARSRCSPSASTAPTAPTGRFPPPTCRGATPTSRRLRTPTSAGRRRRARRAPSSSASGSTSRSALERRGTSGRGAATPLSLFPVR